jgi:hypothetical protein
MNHHTSLPPPSSTAAGTPSGILMQSQGSTILLNPTPSMQSVPSVAAAHSAPVPTHALSWVTPPETPHASGRTHSASSSVSGFGAMRSESEIPRPTVEVDSGVDSAAESGGAKRSVKAADGERPGKRRRIEPTLVPQANSKGT